MFINMVYRYNHNFKILKTYNIEEIDNNIINNELPDKIIYHDNDYDDSLHRMSILYQLKKRDGNKCMCCGKEPNIYALGKDTSNRWHLDLYRNEDDNFLMFTIDHIHPKSKGGENKIENYQLLCKICNEDKGDSTDINFPIKKQNKQYNYLLKKLNTLSSNIKNDLTKIKNQKIVCIKKLKGFTIGKTYKIENININVDSLFKTTYSIFIFDDNNKLINTDLKFFETLNDFILNNKTKTIK